MKKVYAFTLVELLVVISLIILIMALAAGPLNSLRDKRRRLQTEQTFNILTQALLIYKDVTGFFPRAGDTGVEQQAKLYNALTCGDFIIRDYNNNPIKEIINQPCIGGIEDMIEDQIVRESSSPGVFLFYDAWENPIIYLFGRFDYNSSSDPYPGVENPPDSGEFYNCNWGNDKFDLFSYGPDGMSRPDDPSQADDLTNFR